MSDDAPLSSARFRKWLFGEWTVFCGLVTAANLVVVPKFLEVYASVNVEMERVTLAVFWLADHWYMAIPLYLVGAWAILKGALDKHQDLAQVLLIFASFIVPFAYLIALTNPMRHFMQGIRA